MWNLKIPKGNVCVDCHREHVKGSVEKRIILVEAVAFWNHICRKKCKYTEWLQMTVNTTRSKKLHIYSTSIPSLKLWLAMSKIFSNFNVPGLHVKFILSQIKKKIIWKFKVIYFVIFMGMITGNICCGWLKKYIGLAFCKSYFRRITKVHWMIPKMTLNTTRSNVSLICSTTTPESQIAVYFALRWAVSNITEIFEFAIAYNVKFIFNNFGKNQVFKTPQPAPMGPPLGSRENVDTEM